MRTFLLLALTLGITGLTACGGDDDDDGGNAAALASCKQFCDKTANAQCVISIPAELCKQICDAHRQAPAACQNALKAVSDCQMAQPDVCAISGCDAEETAYQEACE